MKSWIANVGVEELVWLERSHDLNPSGLLWDVLELHLHPKPSHLISTSLMLFWLYGQKSTQLCSKL